MGIQVLVVGAGPVGLTMAAELARYGVSVRIIDKAARPTDKSKALVLWSRTLELLDRAGCGSSFVQAGLKVDAANLIAGNKLIGRIGFDGVDSPHPYALMLPQSETECLLQAHLESLGVRVERGVELTGFIDTGAGISATLKDADGADQTVQAEWLVGCDGAHSAVRHGLELPFVGETLASDWILADAMIDGLDAAAPELAIYWHQDGVLATFPITGNRYRVIADIGLADRAKPNDPTLPQVQALVDQRGPGGMLLSNPIWLSAFRINERKVADYRKGRVFVAGDAAHVHSPAGGQGMNTGMQDAFNLAWKLALVCRGSGNETLLLDSYSTERSAIGDQVLANAGRLTAVAVLKNPAGQVLRNMLGGFLFGLTPVRRAMADQLAEVSLGYSHSPLNGPSAPRVGGPQPGERLVPLGGTAAFAATGTPRFAIFAADNEGLRQLQQDYPDLLDPVPYPPLHGGGMWLVRPDGYVAAVTREGGTVVFANYLSRLASTASP